MVNSQSGNEEVQGDPSSIKRKLAWRMGFAGLMIVGLLGGLALFDYLSAPENAEVSVPQFTEPVPVQKKVPTQPVAPVEPPAEAAAGSVESAPESSAGPVDKAAPAQEPPPPPAVAAQPAMPRATSPAARPSAAAPAKPGESRAVASPPATARTEPGAAAVQAPRPSPSTPPRLFSGYALQAGVFSDPRRAEELHARLLLEGIPSTIEARVHVGPFTSRQEAEAARAKLKALGIEAVMLLPKGVKR